MLATAVVWFAVAISAWGYSSPFLSAGLSDHQSSLYPFEDVELRFYFGLLVLAAVFMATALLTNVSCWVGVLVASPGIVLGVRQFHKVRQQANSRFSGYASWGFPTCAVLIVALFVSSREVQFCDTGLYDQQVVKWLSQYGLAAGLALLHFRFGWISSGFAGAAALNHGPLAGREAAIVGGLPFALMIVSSLAIIWRSRSLKAFPGVRALTWVFFCVLLVVATVVWNVESSLSPDPVIWLLPIMLAMLLSDNTESESDRAGCALLLAALARAVKLSAAPLLSYSVVFWCWRFGRDPASRKKLLLYLSIAAAITLLLAVSNKRVSGCPLYPSPIACTFGESSVGADYAAAIDSATREFAKQGSRHAGSLAIVALLATVCSLKMCFKSEFVRHCLAGSWSGILFLLVTAPNPRFGLGYFLLPVAVCVAIVAEWLDREWPALTAVTYKAVPALILAIGLVSTGFSVQTRTSFRFLLLPERMASSVDDSIHVINRFGNTRTSLALIQERVAGMDVLHPQSSLQCWDAPLQCTPFMRAGLLELKDPKKGLSAGFRLSPPYQSLPPALVWAETHQ